MTDPKAKENITLSEKYKLKGAQQMTYADYKALQSKNKKTSKFKIPIFVKFILGTPFIIIFCCGVLFIPYILYLILTSPSAPSTTDKAKSTHDSTR